MKNKVQLKFPAKSTTLPITYDLVKIYDLKINILRASINYNMRGTLLIDVEGSSENFAKAIQYLEGEGIEADFIHPVIKIDSDLCVDCGICTSVCTTRALSILNPDAILTFEHERCVGCDLCINVCPTNAIGR